MEIGFQSVFHQKTLRKKFGQVHLQANWRTGCLHVTMHIVNKQTSIVSQTEKELKPGCRLDSKKLCRRHKHSIHIRVPG